MAIGTGTAVLGAAAIGGISSLLSGIIGSEAASSAATIQEKAALADVALQQQGLDYTKFTTERGRNDALPWLESGRSALDQYMVELGLPPISAARAQPGGAGAPQAPGTTPPPGTAPADPTYTGPPTTTPPPSPAGPGYWDDHRGTYVNGDGVVSQAAQPAPSPPPQGGYDSTPRVNPNQPMARQAPPASGTPPPMIGDSWVNDAPMPPPTTGPRAWWGDGPAPTGPTRGQGQSPSTSRPPATGGSVAPAPSAPGSGFRKTPGYDFMVSEGEKGVMNNLAALGMRGSGAGLKALTRFRMGTADQTYDNYLTRLSNLATGGQQQTQSMGAMGISGANSVAAGLGALSGAGNNLGAVRASSFTGPANQWINALNNGGNIMGNALGWASMHPE